MPSDQGPGIPGWFIAVFVIMVMVGIGSLVWRITTARRMAEEAGLDPNRAAVTTLFSRDGVDAAYLASTLNRGRAAETTPAPRTAEQRLQELLELKNKGLVTQQEYDARRSEILRSI